MPQWTEVGKTQDVKPVPSFLRDMEPSIPYTGDVPTWVKVVSGWSESETVRAYTKVEVIRDRRGEEAAQKWIVENSRNFLDSTIDDNCDKR
jgi:hypothetical protein